MYCYLIKLISKKKTKPIELYCLLAYGVEKAGLGTLGRCLLVLSDFLAF